MINKQMSYYRSPFQLISDLSMIPFGQDVFVISDAKYKELRKTQALEEIAVLQNRAEHFDKAAESLRETIAELQKEHDIVPETADD